MTITEAKKLRVGAVVKWVNGDLGRVVEKGEAGVRVEWNDGTSGVYLFHSDWGTRRLELADRAHV